MRVIIGGISQESNTFSPSLSTMEDFRNHVFVEGKEIETMIIANEINGFYQAASEEQIQCIPTVFGQAVSSGVFSKEAFEELKQLITDHFQRAADYDGVFFAFHGAMVAEGCDDVEGELIQVIRNVIGNEIPFVISLDSHANVTNRMVEQVNGIVGYQTFPHIDFVSTGYRAGKLLHSILQKELQTRLAMVKIPMIVPAENGQTMRGPLAELWKEAFKGEQVGDSIITSLFPVQPWLDIEELGFSVVVVSNNKQKAQQEAERLAKLAWNIREDFDVQLYSVAEIVEKVLSRTVEGPIVISDSADSPGAGSTGDSNAVLKQLLDLGVETRLSCIMTMVDPAAVAQAINEGVGKQVELKVGYTIHVNGGQPLLVSGIVKRIGDGKFLFNEGYAKNTEGNMGRCVVLQIGKIAVLLSEKPTFTGDPIMYRTMGLEPLEQDSVLVKSANQFRAQYEKLSEQIYILDTPGSSTAQLLSLPFTNIKMPFYPFDNQFEWQYSNTNEQTKVEN